MTLYPEFCELLNKYLAPEEGRSQRWLAGRLGVTHVTVNRWADFAVQSRPGDPEIVIRIAMIFGLNRKECEALLNAAEYHVSLEKMKTALLDKEIADEDKDSLVKYINEIIADPKVGKPLVAPPVTPNKPLEPQKQQQIDPLQVATIKIVFQQKENLEMNYVLIWVNKSFDEEHPTIVKQGYHSIYKDGITFAVTPRLHSLDIYSKNDKIHSRTQTIKRKFDAGYTYEFLVRFVWNLGATFWNIREFYTHNPGKLGVYMDYSEHWKTNYRKQSVLEFIRSYPTET